MARKKGTKKSEPGAPRKRKTGKSKKMAKPNWNPSAGAIMLASHGTCSISNPFCPAAQAARYPDNSFTRSVGWSTSGIRVTSPASDANGNTAMLFVPQYQWLYTIGTQPLNTWPNAVMANSFTVPLTFPTNVVRWRLTSWGLKITCALQPLTIQGFLRVRMFSPMSGTSLSTVAMDTVRADSQIDIPLHKLLDEALFVIPMPLGNEARMFRDTSNGPGYGGTLSAFINPGWQVVSVATSGAPGGVNALNIECYYNYEFVFSDDSDSSFFAKAPPSSSFPIQQGNASVLESVGNFVEGSAEKVDKIFQSKAMKYFSAAAGFLLGGPPGAAAGFTGAKMIKDVD